MRGFFFLEAVGAFTLSTNYRRFDGIPSKKQTQPELSNESVQYMYIYSTDMKSNEILSSTLTSAQMGGNSDFRFNNRSTVFFGNINNVNDKTTASGANNILILTISLNTFVILIVCCLCMLCLFCKRKWIFQKIFENDGKGNLYDKNRSYAKGHLEPARYLHKHQDVNIEMMETTVSAGNYSNQNDVPRNLQQERYYTHNVYENDIDPYLVSPMTESELENHQYLTVV